MIYNYKCLDCGSYFEVSCSLKEYSETKHCQTCEDGIGQQIFLCEHLPAVKIVKNTILNQITFDKE